MITANLESDSSKLRESLTVLRNQLLQHSLYSSVQTVKNLQKFMSEHVFAVWDFMSLLKRLQQIVTCCDVPWRPVRDASLARFINEIVLSEESDEDGRGGYSSHFELYLSAMEEIGAETGPVRHFVSQIQRQIPLEIAINDAPILPSTREFVRSTLQLTASGHPHEVAAAFFYGREDVIPDMFARLVESLPQKGVSVERMNHYLRRHIELDSNHHGPLARRLVDSLCDDAPHKEKEVLSAAIHSVSQRISLWDGILAEIHHQ